MADTFYCRFCRYSQDGYAGLEVHEEDVHPKKYHEAEADRLIEEAIEHKIKAREAA